MDSKGLTGRIDSFETTFRTLAEAGLFTSNPEDAYDRIAQAIREARELVEQDQLNTAAENLTRAEFLLYQISWGRSRIWRLNRVHQLPLFLVYILYLFLLSWWSLSPTYLGLPSLWDVPSPVLALGILGAILRGLYWLQFQVSRRIFRTPFILAHLAAPWIGSLLAIGSYLLMEGGLLVVLKSFISSADNDLLRRLVAFLAGFNWIWFLTHLNSAFERWGPGGGGTSR